MSEEKKPISDEDVKKFAKLLISMSTDFLTGGINKATFIHNLRIMADTLSVCAYPSFPTVIPRNDLLKRLEMCRIGLCLDIDKQVGEPCRCVYGVKSHLDTGCPELRYVIGLLKAMSDDEMGYFESRRRAIKV